MLPKGRSADYIVSGSWSKAAVAEGKKFGDIRAINVIEEAEGLKSVKPVSEWQLDSNAAYVHYCPNETVDGIEMFDIPDTGNVPLVADMSSTILSRKMDISKFGLIYAGAQKNIGPSGLSIVIVREDLIGHQQLETPCIMDYKLTADNDSMYNTPPTYAWYLAGLVFDWLTALGGVGYVEEINKKKAQLLYDYIDQSDFYSNSIANEYRSRMNVPFWLNDESLNDVFLSLAKQAGLLALKGHRMVGGMRASIYNAMPMEGVIALVEFMKSFEQGNQ